MLCVPYPVSPMKFQSLLATWCHLTESIDTIYLLFVWLVTCCKTRFICTTGESGILISLRLQLTSLMDDCVSLNWSPICLNPTAMEVRLYQLLTINVFHITCCILILETNMTNSRIKIQFIVSTQSNGYWASNIHSRWSLSVATSPQCWDLRAGEFSVQDEHWNNVYKVSCRFMGFSTLACLDYNQIVFATAYSWNEITSNSKDQVYFAVVDRFHNRIIYRYLVTMFCLVKVVVNHFY